MDADAIDAAWAHQEELQRELEQMLSEMYPRIFNNRRNEVKTSQMIQSKFLKKEDFPSPEVLTIADVSLEEVGKGDERWVLFFKEKTKGVVLNVTKIKQLETAYGDDSDNWKGKKVKLSHDPTVMMGTQQVGGIKFTFPSNLPPVAPRALQPIAPVADDFNDDIPF